MKKRNYPYYTYMPEYINFRDMVKQTTEKFSDDIVFSYRNRHSDPAPTCVTYAELASHIKAIGTQALAEGFGKAHIAVIGKLSYNWISVYFSVLSIGAVLVPLDRDWTEEDLGSTLSKAECTVLFCDDDIREKGEKAAASSGIANIIFLGGKEGQTLESFRKKGEALVAGGDNSFDTAEIDPHALAELVFTSGTTGKGKGVMLSQKALLSNLHGAFSILKISKKTISVLPPHHTYGSTISLLSGYCNGTNAYISSGLRFFLSELAEQKPEHMILVPLYMETFYRRIWATAKKSGKENLLKKMIKVSNALRKTGIDMRKAFFGKSVLSVFGGELKTIVCGGAPLSQEIIDAFDDFGIQVLNGYGITECSPLISANRLLYTVPNSVGIPIPEEEIFIDNPNEDGEGEICIRGPHVMLGYFKDEEATKQAIDENGFFHTGDIGKLEKDAICITGRVKNLIILSNGKNVYPEEIESALSTIPGITDVVVYEGISKRGPANNAIVAEIYPDKEYLGQNSVTNFSEYFSEHVNNYNRHAVPYKKIGVVRIREDEFPKNTLRKIMRFKIDKTID